MARGASIMTKLNHTIVRCTVCFHRVSALFQ